MKLSRVNWLAWFVGCALYVTALALFVYEAIQADEEARGAQPLTAPFVIVSGGALFVLMVAFVMTVGEAREALRDGRTQFSLSATALGVGIVGLLGSLFLTPFILLIPVAAAIQAIRTTIHRRNVGVDVSQQRADS